MENKHYDFPFYKWEKEKANDPFLRQPFGDNWEEYTWSEVGIMARKIASAIESYNLPPKSHIGLISKNCREWIIADLAIINTYYLGLLANSSDKKDREVAKQLHVFFPNQNDRGTHINVSGGAVTASSKNENEAIKFLEFLTEEQNQKVFSQSNYEYPLDYQSTKAETLMRWGKFKAEEIDLSILGHKNTEAVKLFDLAGWE